MRSAKVCASFLACPADCGVTCDADKLEEVKQLAAKIGDVNFSRKLGTPLTLACICGHLGALLCFITSVAIVRHRRYGRIPHPATSRSGTARHSGLELVPKSGSNCSCHCIQNGRTALYIAALSGHMDIVQLLIQHGAKLEAKSHVSCAVCALCSKAHRCFQEGLTPLFVAAWRGHMKIVRYLVDQRANIDVTDKVGFELV